MAQHSHSLIGAATPFGLESWRTLAHQLSPPPDSSSLKAPLALSKLLPVGPVVSGLEPVASSTLLAPVHALPEIVALTKSNAPDSAPRRLSLSPSSL